MRIQKDISLAQYTSFKTGGQARYFAVIKTIGDLQEGMNFAQRNSLPVFILGKGSNILVSDNGFNGLILKMEIKNFHLNHLDVQHPSDNNVEIVAGAGEVWDDLVSLAIKKSLFGMENLSGIPGTVGASVVQNIGAFGAEVSEIVSWVEVFDIETEKIKKLNNQECGFGYRTSIFKTAKGKNLIVIKVCYKLKTKGKLKLNYASLREELKNFKHFVRQGKNIGINDVRKVIIKIRKEKYPDLKKIGTAGCFFKNPIITTAEFEKLKKQFPNLPVYNLPNGKIKILLTWLVDKIGWKGYRNGNVGIHKNHALMIVNYGGGTTKEIKNLANKISKDVFEKTNLKIFPEVVFV